MASDRLKELMNQVESLSDTYARASTDLSDQIVAFEETLNRLKGKVEVEVPGHGSSLSFRRKGPNWALFVNRETPLTSASVEAKALAIVLFEPLLEQMAQIHADRSEQIESACREMTRISAELGLKRKEG